MENKITTLSDGEVMEQLKKLGVSSITELQEYYREYEEYFAVEYSGSR
ncbi:MAG: hypothetical protein ISR96_03350 [Nitrospira sp.]|nr:hypothetical protein [bacterium]MBL7048551.1 hypothetical protein [Nitrospira sp.]